MASAVGAHKLKFIIINLNYKLQIRIRMFWLIQLFFHNRIICLMYRKKIKKNELYIKDFVFKRFC